MAYSVDELIELVRRNTDDEGWLQPILDDPSSLAVLKMALEPLARESQAIDRLRAQATVSLASGGSPGTTALVLQRLAAGVGGTIPAGYKFEDLRGVKYISQAAVAVAAGVLSVTVPVETVRRTEVVNHEGDPGFRIDPTASTVLDSGGVNPLIAPAGTVGLVATSFSTVFSGGPIEGASADWLSVHGHERGTRRQQSEDAASYRLRVRDIPDAVSPIGVADGVLAAASRSGYLPVPSIQEPFADQASADIKADHFLAEFQPLYSDGNTAPDNPAHSEFYDDPMREAVSLREVRAYFRVVMAQPLNPDGSAAFVPAPPAVATAPSSAILGALLAVAEEAARRKAFGVQFDVYVSEPVLKVGVGSSATLAEAIVFTLQPAAGRAWYFRNGHVGHDPTPSGVVLTLSHTHRVTFTFTDATTFTTPFNGSLDEERLDPYKAAMSGFPYNKKIAKIEGKLVSDNTNAINLVGSFYLTEVRDP